MFRVVVTTALILYFVFNLNHPRTFVFAQSSEDFHTDTYPHISALENAILGQTFIDQPVATRLSRMEKKAFGKESNITDLSDRTDALDDYTEKQLHKKLRSENEDEESNLAQNNLIGNQADYPHVTALEQAIIGQTFAGQALPDRLARMEIKAFGKASSSADLSDRTDALDDYTYNHLHKNLLQANTNITQDKLIQDEVDFKQTDYPHITALERAILGQTFTGEIPSSRLGRMEIKAFGSVSNSPDLGERTDALDRYAQKNLHKQTLNRLGDADDDDESSQRGGLLSKVEKAVIGMAGGGIGSGPGGLGMGGIGFPGLAGMGFGGMGPPGMGNGYGGVGGGSRGAMHNHQPNEQQKEQAQPGHQEDPAVYKDSPPEPNSKMLVKVGWCEVQLFTHTFPAMHLPERLGQINKELHLEPGKSDIQLMDDIGLMIKAVQKRKEKGPDKTP